jgi:flagellar basal-body rod modification protein FlgD
MIAGISGAIGNPSIHSPASTVAAATANAATGTDPLAQKDTFLQLLVAQIRNQDPLRPTDGVEFLSQLAQFSSLEQSIQLKDEVASVRKAVEDLTEAVKNQATGAKTGVPQA